MSPRSTPGGPLRRRPTSAGPLRPSVLLAAVAAGLIVAAVVLFAVSPSPPGGRADAPPSAAPRIYGATAPSATTPPPGLGAARAEAKRVARRWAAAWTRLTACPAQAPQSLGRVLALSTGELRDTLEVSPPRPTAATAETGANGAACEPARLKRVEVHRVEDGWYAIAVREGDGLRPLRLRLHAADNDGALRVAAIDF